MKKTCAIDTIAEVSQKVETDARKSVETSDNTESKEVNVDVTPCIAIITKDKQEVETSENVPENVETEVVNNFSFYILWDIFR